MLSGLHLLITFGMIAMDIPFKITIMPIEGIRKGNRMERRKALDAREEDPGQKNQIMFKMLLFNQLTLK